MLKMLEPNTTPAAVAADPLATAATDDEISGESAQSATISPTRPPSSPRLRASRPTPRTRTSLAPSVATSATIAMTRTTGVDRLPTGQGGTRARLRHVACSGLRDLQPGKALQSESHADVRVRTTTISTLSHLAQRSTAPGDCGYMYACCSPMSATVPHDAHDAARIGDVVDEQFLRAGRPSRCRRASAASRPCSCQPPVGPNRSVLIRAASWPSCTSASATDSTSGVGPQTKVKGCCVRRPRDLREHRRSRCAGGSRTSPAAATASACTRHRVAYRRRRDGRARRDRSRHPATAPSTAGAPVLRSLARRDDEASP